jgi:hypothetical protein
MPWAVRALRERLPSVELLPAFGLTEGTPLATVSSMEGRGEVPGRSGQAVCDD